MNEASENAFDPYTIATHLWALYLVGTEAFDRRLTGRPSKHDPDSWIPTTPEGRGQSTRFARELNQRVCSWLTYLCIDRKISDAARGTVERMRFVAQQSLAERIKITESINAPLAVEIDGRLLALPPAPYQRMARDYG